MERYVHRWTSECLTSSDVYHYSCPRRKSLLFKIAGSHFDLFILGDIKLAISSKTKFFSLMVDKPFRHNDKSVALEVTRSIIYLPDLLLKFFHMISRQVSILSQNVNTAILNNDT